MLQYKASLAILNSRYGDLERRLIEQFAIRRIMWQKWRTMKDTIFGPDSEFSRRELFIAKEIQGDQRAAMARLLQQQAAELESSTPPDMVQLPGGQGLLLWYLVRDGYLVQHGAAGIEVNNMPLVEIWKLTSAGADFVDRWADAMPLDIEVRSSDRVGEV